MWHGKKQHVLCTAHCHIFWLQYKSTKCCLFIEQLTLIFHGVFIHTAFFLFQWTWILSFEHLRIIEWCRAFSTNTFALKNAFDLENGVPLLGHGCCNRFTQTPQMPQLAKSTSFSPQTSLNKNRINWNISSLSLFSLGFFPKNVSHFWTALVMSWFRNASTLLNCPLAMWPAPFNPHPVTWREQLQEFGWIQN